MLECFPRVTGQNLGQQMKTGLANGARTVAVAFTIAGAGTVAALADQVIADDLLVQQSLCVGVSCAVGEPFVNESLRLKQNLNRIRVVDTSPSGGQFGYRDWLIDFNEDGGPGDFMSFVDNGDGGEVYRRIMVLRAGAPSNSLYVDWLGRIGLGTAAPARNLHIVSGNTPTLRLDQDASVGFSPQAWDLSGNEDFFDIRDATTGAVPLRIEADASTDSLYIRSTGRVGMGTSAAGAPLEVRSFPATIGAGNAVLKLVNPAGPTAMQMQPFGSGFFWNFAASDNNTFNINRSGNSAVEMSLNGSGNLTISGTIKTAGPTCAAGCDAVFDTDYKLPTIEEHAEAMWAKKHLPNVGPTLPNEPVDLSERYGLMLNELETAHIYIEQLHREKAELARSDEEMRTRLARLEAVLADKLRN
jgi:hypothetical protein